MKKRVWVKGYRRRDGTPVKGHWSYAAQTKHQARKRAESKTARPKGWWGTGDVWRSQIAAYDDGYKQGYRRERQEG